jgi:hypothetical protein
MKNLLWIILLFTGIVISPGNASAQENQNLKLYHVETKDGNEFTGYIVSRDSASILLKTETFGEISIHAREIKVIQPIETGKLVDGKYWFGNPQSTRYFWSPNGYGLKTGEGYYQNMWIFFNQVSVGITDNISIGGGIIPLFLFAGNPTPVWITPKVSIPVAKDKFNIGAGALVGTIIGENNSGFGILYGITTFGSRDTNLNLGLGYGYIGGKLSSTPAFNISGMIRTGSHSYLISENYFLTSGDQTLLLLSFGGRWMIKKAGLDGFLVIPSTSDLAEFIAIPMLGITIPFGTSK